MLSKDSPMTRKICVVIERLGVDAASDSWYDVDSARIACSRFVLAAVRHGFCGAAWGIPAPHEGNVRLTPHEGNVRLNPHDGNEQKYFA